MPLPEHFYTPGWNYDNYVRRKGRSWTSVLPRHGSHLTRRSLQALYPKIAASPSFTNDTALASYHIIRHRENWKPGEGVAVFEWMAENYEPWRASAAAGRANFLLFHFCDHVVDCGYMGRSGFGALDPLYSPSSETRIVRFIAWNGRGDVHDGECESCFLPHIDIAVPTAENACGPLCGANRETLTRFAAWREEEAPTSLAGAIKYVSDWPLRRTKMFWSGQVSRHAHSQPASSLDLKSDVSGRNLFYARWKAEPGYELYQSYDWDADKAVKPYNWSILEKMRDSTFCFSPLGHRGGDMDRYLPAILTGCIPVFFEYVYSGGRKHSITPPLAGLINWQQIAVIITPEQVNDLDAILDGVHVLKKRAHMWNVWRSMLWSGFYGSYLGEDPAEGDALVSTFKLLHMLSIKDHSR